MLERAASQALIVDVLAAHEEELTFERLASSIIFVRFVTEFTVGRDVP